MGLIDALRRRLRQAGAPSEDATDRDGAFSHKAESHAFAIGLWYGLYRLHARPCDPPDHPDVRKERPYYAAGFYVGTVTQALIVVAVVVTIAGTL